MFEHEYNQPLQLPHEFFARVVLWSVMLRVSVVQLQQYNNNGAEPLKRMLLLQHLASESEFPLRVRYFKSFVRHATDSSPTRHPTVSISTREEQVVHVSIGIVRKSKHKNIETGSTLVTNNCTSPVVFAEERSRGTSQILF